MRGTAQGCLFASSLDKVKVKGVSGPVHFLRAATERRHRWFKLHLSLQRFPRRLNIFLSAFCSSSFLSLRLSLSLCIVVDFRCILYMCIHVYECIFVYFSVCRREMGRWALRLSVGLGLLAVLVTYCHAEGEEVNGL